jgi:hypothetical protein
VVANGERRTPEVHRASIGGGQSSKLSAMPARKRNRQPTFTAPTATTAPMSDVERFAAAMKVTEAKEQAAAEARRVVREAEAKERAERQQQAEDAARHAAELKRARAAKDRAVDRLKEARRAGRGVPEAESAWRDATAAVVELETGQRATWDRRPVAAPDPADQAESTEPPESTEGAESSEPADEQADT